MSNQDSLAKWISSKSNQKAYTAWVKTDISRLIESEVRKAIRPAALAHMAAQVPDPAAYICGMMEGMHLMIDAIFDLQDHEAMFETVSDVKDRTAELLLGMGYSEEDAKRIISEQEAKGISDAGK